MSAKKLPSNLCITVHCLTNSSQPKPLVYPEFFIHNEALEELINHLIGLDYEFVWPGLEKIVGRKTCSVTFDDGYANNLLFLEIAEKYNIPVLYFVASYNIQNQSPFLWDYVSLKKIPWKFHSDSYLKLYEGLAVDQCRELLESAHRPLTLEEFKYLSQHPLIKLAAHSHTHQPLISNVAEMIDEEVSKNLEFLQKYTTKEIKDFALPSGLFCRRTLNKLFESFNTIYTIDGGSGHRKNGLINRVSLINETLAGPLIDQIEKSCSLKYKIIRKYTNIRYSH